MRRGVVDGSGGRCDGLVFVLVLVVHRSESIIWMLDLVLLLLFLGTLFPIVLLFERKLAPAIAYKRKTIVSAHQYSKRWAVPDSHGQTENSKHTNDFRQTAMICLDRPRDVSLLHKVRSEQHESVGRSRDVSLAGPLPWGMALASWGLSGFLAWRKQSWSICVFRWGCVECILEVFITPWFYVCAWCNVRSECDWSWRNW